MKLSKTLSYGWLIFCALLVVIPMLVIMMALGSFDAEIWQFLLEFQLPILLKNTLFLAFFVAIGVSVLGISLAWLISMYRFPLRDVFAVAMMLPMAMPAYVMAFCLVGLFEYHSALNLFFREHLSIELPDIRNLFGLSAVMSLAFYPYVYLLAKNAFGTMGERAMEVGAVLGLSPSQAFFRIALPMARPFIAGGLVLALMEVLADFGTVSVFNYETFTTAIYEAWFGFFSLETAKQLAFMLVCFVLILIVFEELSRGKQKFYEIGRGRQKNPKNLTGLKKYLAFGYCALILLAAFIIPLLQLLVWAYQSFEGVLWQELFDQTLHSFSVSLLMGAVVSLVALFLVMASAKIKPNHALILSRISTLGYAIPGTVLAVGIFVPIAWLDNYLIALFALETDAILKGTLWMMVLAFLVRFLALGVQSVQAGANRIKQSHLEAAYTLGKNRWQTLYLVYLPMIKGALGVAALMTFVDVMKEIPITLMMRPTGFDMLSARIYAFTTEGMYDKAAFASLIIIAVGLVPVIWFSRLDDKATPRAQSPSDDPNTHSQPKGIL